MELPYILLVGPRLGYKNGDVVQRAFYQARARQLHLFMVGGGPPTEREREILGGPHFNVSWSWARFLNDSDLAAAYSGAVALAYASRDEGFGLPMLEALACGCPAARSPALWASSCRTVNKSCSAVLVDPDAGTVVLHALSARRCCARRLDPRAGRRAAWHVEEGARRRCLLFLWINRWLLLWILADPPRQHAPTPASPRPRCRRPARARVCGAPCEDVAAGVLNDQTGGVLSSSVRRANNEPPQFGFRFLACQALPPFHGSSLATGARPSLDVVRRSHPRAARRDADEPQLRVDVFQARCVCHSRRRARGARGARRRADDVRGVRRSACPPGAVSASAAATLQGPGPRACRGSTRRAAVPTRRR